MNLAILVLALMATSGVKKNGQEYRSIRPSIMLDVRRHRSMHVISKAQVSRTRGKGCLISSVMVVAEEITVGQGGAAQIAVAESQKSRRVTRAKEGGGVPELGSPNQ